MTMIRQEAKRSPKIIRWSSDGLAFFIDDEAKFIGEILPRHKFKATKIQSFQRNLNIYGFTRATTGIHKMGYRHPDFSRDDSNGRKLEYINRHAKPDPVMVPMGSRSRSSSSSSSSSSSQSPLSSSPSSSGGRNMPRKKRKKTAVVAPVSPVSPPMNYGGRISTTLDTNGPVDVGQYLRMFAKTPVNRAVVL
jgi:hypothetical protein